MNLKKKIFLSVNHSLYWYHIGFAKEIRFKNKALEWDEQKLGECDEIHAAGIRSKKWL